MRLRRTIGLKKDEYHLDKKHITCVPGPSPYQRACCVAGGIMRWQICQLYPKEHSFVVAVSQKRQAMWACLGGSTKPT